MHSIKKPLNLSFFFFLEMMLKIAIVWRSGDARMIPGSVCLKSLIFCWFTRKAVHMFEGYVDFSNPKESVSFCRTLYCMPCCKICGNTISLSCSIQASNARFSSCREKKYYLFNGNSLMLLVTVFMDQLSIVSTFFFIIWWQKCGLYNGNLLICLLTVSLRFMDHNFRLLPLWKRIFIQDDHFLINFVFEGWECANHGLMSPEIGFLTQGFYS